VRPAIGQEEDWSLISSMNHGILREEQRLKLPGGQVNGPESEIWRIKVVRGGFFGVL